MGKTGDSDDDTPNIEPPSAEDFGFGHNGSVGSGSQIVYTKEVITPEQAADYLKNIKEGIREDSKAIANYAAIMKAGQWIRNGQSILFDRDGNLLDGYHRLRACIEAGVSFPTWIARGADPDTLHTIDQHRRRSYAGVLEAHGIKHAGTLVRTMSKLIRYENGILGKQETQISWGRYGKVLEANPELFEAVQIAEETVGCALHSTPRPVLCFMALKAGHRKALRQFLAALSNPMAHEDNHPGKSLANQFTALRNVEARIDLDYALAISILAFNDFLEGRKPKGVYDWKPDYGKKGRIRRKITGTGEYEVKYDWKYIRKNAPDNLGMPRMIGYPGLEQGSFDLSQDVAALEEQARKSSDGETSESDRDLILSGTVTPELAAEWLQKFNPRNRKIQRTHITRLVRDIRRGNWRVNAQPIVFQGNPFDPEGDVPPQLLNGQHRLRACVEADMPIEVAIGINFDAKAFDTYDTHSKRTAATGQAPGDERVIRGAAVFIFREKEGLPLDDRQRPTESELLDILERHPGLSEAFYMARKMEAIGQPGPVTYLIERVQREDPELGPVFIEQLKDGVGLERGNPVVKLRAEAIAMRSAGARDRKNMLNELVRGWKAFLKWHKDKSREAPQQDLL